MCPSLRALDLSNNVVLDPTRLRGLESITSLKLGNNRGLPHGWRFDCVLRWPQLDDLDGVPAAPARKQAAALASRAEAAVRAAERARGGAGLKSAALAKAALAAATLPGDAEEVGGWSRSRTRPELNLNHFPSLRTGRFFPAERPVPVSYTHLTLPTIYSV